MIRCLIIALFGIGLFSSCVTNKKYTLMQHDDVNPRKGQLKKDSVIRSYSLEPFTYKFQTNDLVSIRFESLTSEQYDFLSGFSQLQTSGNLNSGNALLIGELVDEKGEIPFPVIGKVKVGGLSVFEVQDTLQTLANVYLESPIVKVRLLNYRITMLGELNKEGTITLPNNRVSILEAIGLAGGLTDLADKRNVKIIRQVGDSTTVAYLNILDEDFINSPFYYVHQNDILVVGALRQRPYRKYLGQNLALIVSSASLILLIYNISQN